MRDEKIIVHAHCGRCGVNLVVDLDLVCAMRGRAFSLINATGRCKVVGCSGRTFFSACQPGAGVPMMRLTDRDRD